MDLLPDETLVRSEPAEAEGDADLGILRPGWRRGTLHLTSLRLAFREDGPLGAHHDLLLGLELRDTGPDAVLKAATRRVPIDGHPLLVHSGEDGTPVPSGAPIATFQARWLGLFAHGPPVGLELTVRNAITGSVGPIRYRLADVEGWVSLLRTG